MKIEVQKFDHAQQKANVCVLFSYWRFVKYFNPKVTFPLFCKEYIQYIKSQCDFFALDEFKKYVKNEIQNQKKNPNHNKKDLDQECSLLANPESINDLNRLNEISLEVLTSAVFHYYCQKVANNIRGLYHISEFHKTFISNPIPSFKIPKSKINFTQNAEEIKQALDDTQNGRIDFLIILYKLNNNNGHTIMLINYNNSIYVGDPNIDRLKKYTEYEKIESYQNKFDINHPETITECIIINCEE